MDHIILVKWIILPDKFSRRVVFLLNTKILCKERFQILLFFFGTNILWRFKVWTFWLFRFVDLRIRFYNLRWGFLQLCEFLQWLEFYNIFTHNWLKLHFSWYICTSAGVNVLVIILLFKLLLFNTPGLINFVNIWNTNLGIIIFSTFSIIWLGW